MAHPIFSGGAHKVLRLTGKVIGKCFGDFPFGLTDMCEVERSCYGLT